MSMIYNETTGVVAEQPKPEDIPDSAPESPQDPGTPPVTSPGGDPAPDAPDSPQETQEDLATAWERGEPVQVERVDAGGAADAPVNADDEPSEKQFKHNYQLEVPDEDNYNSQYGIIVVVEDEAEQIKAFANIKALGYTVRVVTI